MVPPIKSSYVPDPRPHRSAGRVLEVAFCFGVPLLRCERGVWAYDPEEEQWFRVDDPMASRDT